MIGRSYIWRGERWTVMARWGKPELVHEPHLKGHRTKGPPRNVLIVNEAGDCLTRPFRGLRREK